MLAKTGITQTYGCLRNCRTVIRSDSRTLNPEPMKPDPFAGVRFFGIEGSRLIGRVGGGAPVGFKCSKCGGCGGYFCSSAAVCWCVVKKILKEVRKQPPQPPHFSKTDMQLKHLLSGSKLVALQRHFSLQSRFSAYYPLDYKPSESNAYFPQKHADLALVDARTLRDFASRLH